MTRRGLLRAASERHKYAIDVLVIALTLGVPNPVVVSTSDRDDCPRRPLPNARYLRPAGIRLLSGGLSRVLAVRTSRPAPSAAGAATSLPQGAAEVGNSSARWATCPAARDDLQRQFTGAEFTARQRIVSMSGVGWVVNARVSIASAVGSNSSSPSRFWISYALGRPRTRSRLLAGPTWVRCAAIRAALACRGAAREGGAYTSVVRRDPRCPAGPAKARTGAPTARSVLEEVFAPTDRAACRAEDPQDGADHDKRSTDRRQKRNTGQHSDNEQNNAKNNHAVAHPSYCLWSA